MSTGLDRNSYQLLSYIHKAKNMCEFIALPLILCSVSFGLTQGTSSFDQRQTGDFNVQIGLKNIQLIALLKGGKEEYVDYDYAYDYSEMTIKPQNGTTPKPLNVTNQQMQSNSTTLPPILVENSTIPATIQENSSISPNLSNQLTNVTEPNFISTEVNSNEIAFTNNSAALKSNGTLFNVNITKISNSALANNETNQTTNFLSVTSTRIPEITADEATTVVQDSLNNVSASQASNCRRGFVQNHQGKCEYKVHGTTNALRRIVKLAQKIKIGRGYKET